MKLVAFIDGSSLGNPGEAGYGVVLKDEGGKIVATVGRYIGRATNNVAEYRGLLSCLELAKQYGVSSLTVYSDSQLLVNQIRGIYRVRASHLQEIHGRILDMIASSGMRFEIVHVPREKNREADGLARQAIRIRIGD